MRNMKVKLFIVGIKVIVFKILEVKFMDDLMIVGNSQKCTFHTWKYVCIR